MKTTRFIFYVFIGLVTITGFIIVIDLKNKQIERLRLLEKPFYAVDNSSEITHKYFSYNDIEFSTLVKEESFYGCDMKDSNTRTAVYCNLYKDYCMVESIDLNCMNSLDINAGFDITLNESNCTTIYEIKGNYSKWVY